MTLLTDDAIDEAIGTLEGWERDGDAIAREWEAPSFLDGVDRVGQVAGIAEEADHHPDIDIRWRTVKFSLSTHSEGGVTQADVDLAHKIDSLLG